MKKILLLLGYFFILQVSKAQTEEHAIKTINGTEYDMGTKVEYMQQSGLESGSYHKLLCKFIGYKSYWMMNLFAYMDKQLSLTLDTSFYDKKTGISKMRFVPHIYSGELKNVIYLRVKVGPDDRIRYMNISGDSYDVIYLFTSFWPTLDQAYSKKNIQKGKLYFKYVDTEKISLSWTNENPSLTITKEKGMLRE